MNPYTAHDASAENGGVPVFNVKGPGYDRLITGDVHKGVEEHAKALADDLNEAYEAGRLAELRAKSRGGVE